MAKYLEYKTSVNKPLRVVALRETRSLRSKGQSALSIRRRRTQGKKKSNSGYMLIAI